MYTWQRDANLPDGPVISAPVKKIQGEYTLEITPTFSIEDDPFALQSDTQKTDTVELRLNGQLIQLPDEAVSRGSVIKLDDIPELSVGFNEFFISAGPPISEINLDHGIRLRLLEGENILVDDTIWAANGARVSGTVSFKISIEKDHDHDH